MTLAFQPDLVERSLLGNTLGFGKLVLDNLPAAFFDSPDDGKSLLRQSDLAIEFENLERLLPADLEFTLFALARDPRRLQLQFEVDLLALGLFTGS